MYGRACFNGLSFAAVLFTAVIVAEPSAIADDDQNQPRVSYADASHSTVLLSVDGKQYLVNVAAHSVSEAPNGSNTTSAPAASSAAAGLFRQNCASCHGDSGHGIAAGTPNLADPAFQKRFADAELIAIIHNGRGGMPGWAGKLSDSQIGELVTYVRSLAQGGGASQSGPSTQEVAAKPGIYQPGDDVLMSLPTGRPVDEHGVYVNFSHRFPYDSAVSGTSRGSELFGLDNFGLSSFGFRYGVTDRLSVDVWRSPTFIGRPIQLMAAYNLFEERHGAPLNLAVRVSIEGQDNFKKNYTENIEAIFSRSLTSRAQFYAVPTISFNDRRLVQASGFASDDIPDLPGINAFSIGFGLAVDIRPTVALVSEVIPTLVNGDELGIHRPAYSFGIQKKIYRHAFTLGLTNSPGTTVSQRAGTRATFLGEPNADTPAGLFFGFDLTRQIH
jgi:mono/diheme cytochrome c family protein